MRVSLSFHGINETSRSGLRELFEERAACIDRHLSSFNPDLARMEARIEKSSHHHLYRVSLRLKLPTGVLACGAEEHELRPVLQQAFAELERRTERHLARLRRTHLWSRVSRIPAPQLQRESRSSGICRKRS
jgi:ribosome-associated translation inhibitor RaiA